MVIIPSISLPAPLTLAPRLGNMLGGTALLVSGPCLEATDQITCVFGETAVTGIYIIARCSRCVSHLPSIQLEGYGFSSLYGQMGHQQSDIKERASFTQV